MWHPFRHPFRPDEFVWHLVLSAVCITFSYSLQHPLLHQFVGKYFRKVLRTAYTSPRLSMAIIRSLIEGRVVVERDKSTQVDEALLTNYADYYVDGASEWRRICAIDKASNIVNLCGERRIDSILEVGAGEGSVTHRLSEIGFARTYAAIDISETGVEAIRAKNIPGLFDCKVFDGYTIPYDDNAFDLVVLSHVVEHVEHPRKLLYEAKRVARYVFIEVPLEATLRQPQDFVLDAVGHINFYSPKTIRRLLQSSGLHVLRQEVFNPSKDTYSFYGGKKGIARFFVKTSLLKLVPRVATELFTYHGALLCEDAGDLIIPERGEH